jgi:hypothetical protein
MDSAVAALSPYFGEGIARLIVAVFVLLIGWLIATILGRIVSGLLKRLQVDNRIARSVTPSQGGTYPVENWVGTAVFWIVLLFFIVAALDVLNLTAISTPINNVLNDIVGWLPGLLAAAILALIAHVIGTVARKLVTGALGARRVDERLAASSGTTRSISNPLGDAVYYLIWLLFLPAILGALGVESLLVPVQNMIDQFLTFLPFLAAAVILFIVGWFVARIVQRIVESFLASAGVDAFAERVGIAKYMGSMTVSRLLGLIVFILILIPVITASLDALNLDSLTAPLTAMLNEVITAIPNYVAAAALLIITYVVARWLIGIGVEILGGFGINSVPRALGLGTSESIGGRTLAQWIGDIALLVVMLLAAVQAAQLIGWDAVTLAIGTIGAQIVQIIFGLIIIAVGVYLANLAYRFVMGTTMPNKRLLAIVARVSIIAFAGAMGLTAMGFAAPIVIIAFAFFVGAIAVAVALAFGLGGRQAAAQQIEEWSASLKRDELPPAPPTTTVPPTIS